MKSSIQHILPAVLAPILPGLSLYSKSGLEITARFGFWGTWLIASVLLYACWYFLWHIWELRSGKPQIRVIGILAGSASVIVAILTLLVINGTEDFRWINMVRFLLAIILLMAIQYALKTQLNIAKLQLEKEQIQTENYKAQLKALQAKIDPHFLFNSLNTLRSMVRQHHPNSEDFIMSLSDFYRQTLKYNEDTTLSLSEELAVLQSYLFLMKSRNEDAVRLHIDVDKGLHTHHLPTLALQVVVENCFKHNSMTSKMPLHINISNTGENYLVIRNNIQPKIGDKPPSGYGLEVLRKRYEWLQVEKGITVQESDQEFVVQLKLLQR